VRREDPNLDHGAIAATLAEHYGVCARSFAYLPLGFDLHAFVYDVAADDGRRYFLKIRDGAVHEAGLLVASTLVDHGVTEVLAPLRTRAGAISCALTGHAGYGVVLFPFIAGRNATEVGLSDEQWRDFGRAMRMIQTRGLEPRFAKTLRTETFTLPSAALVRRMLALVLGGARFASPAAERFAAFWREHAERIEAMLARAEALGHSLQAKTFPLVLCHGDIHSTNILVGRDGRIWLVDWDGPLIAPRERDLLFVVGSRIGRPVTPAHEACFFAGYGPVAIDPEALTYYRNERMVVDLGEIGKSVFVDPAVGEAVRAPEAELAMGMFAPGEGSDWAEAIHRTRWP
jgi:spectinomycin phosphotransferase